MRTYLTNLITLLLAIFFGMVVLWTVSKAPIIAIESFFLLPLRNFYFLSQILVGAVPLIFTGLAAFCSFSAGVFNIGLEGQLYFATLAGTFVALHLKGFQAVFFALLVAFIVGSAVASLSAFLKIKLNIDELITTFLVSNGLIHVTNFLLNTYLRDPMAALSATKYLHVEVLTIPGLNVHVGFLVAILLAIWLQMVFEKSVLGYQMRLVGGNVVFSRYAGIDVEKTWWIAFALSGGLAALGGMVDVLAVHGRMIRGFSFGYGWNGIAVALLAKNKPFFVIFSALFFSYLETGAQIASIFADVTPEIARLVQASVFYLVTAEALASLKRRVSK
ncbi:ABC transporter permease [Pseudothermotoga thermarum]|uniref:Inner-membrane translocator n=1 Tax=Pseudothermotoga thermarum DSM 5069 TaxID=688269 RepID=F7YUZ5_9THEM|nr:ABC transporter permease [Pseudothermotoga thermarum]AEH50279.1 inner-membrane translocator [Pseudothermotoga thermarum DSM 5069]